MTDLGQQITHNDRLTGAGHAEEDTMLWRVTNTGSDSNQVAASSVVNRFGIFQMTGESGGPRDQIGQIGVFRRQVEGAVTTISPARPSLVKQLAGVLRNGGMMNDSAAHGGECVPQRSRSGRQHISRSVPKPHDIQTI